MHIPDGFLDLSTSASTLALSALGLAWAVRDARKSLLPKRVPLVGVSAAFVFAAQMVNFPVAAGTSGHLLGGVLLSVLLGPSAAVIAMSSVLVVQCLFFADGGLLALGANVFNMAIVGAVGGYTIYSFLERRLSGHQGQLIACAFASWCSVVFASAFCALELAASGTAPLSLVFPAMVLVHMLIGIGEAAIAMLVLAAVYRTRPSLLRTSPEIRELSWGSVISVGLLLAFLVAVFLSPFASSSPDGLERIAENLGFLEQGEGSEPLIAPLMPDYQAPGWKSPVMATAFAGAFGTIAMFIFAHFFARIIVRREENGAGESGLRSSHAS